MVKIVLVEKEDHSQLSKCILFLLKTNCFINDRIRTLNTLFHIITTFEIIRLLEASIIHLEDIFCVYYASPGMWILNEVGRIKRTPLAIIV